MPARGDRAPARRPARRVCVHVPSYNHRQFLAEAIESVLAQTYRDFHVVIVDDCSTDGSQDLIRDYAERHPDRIAAVFNERNLGIPRRLGVALGHCGSEYFTYLDGDDVWHPDALESMVEVLDGRPEVGLVHGNVEIFDNATGRTIGVRHTEDPPVGHIFEDLVIQGCIVGATAAALRRRCLEETNVSLEDPPFAISADYYIWLSLASRYEVACVPRILARHRRHEGNTSGRGPWLEEKTRCIRHLASRCPWTVPRLVACYEAHRQKLSSEVSRLEFEYGRYKFGYERLASFWGYRLYRRLKRLLGRGRERG